MILKKKISGSVIAASVFLITTSFTSNYHSPEFTTAPFGNGTPSYDLVPMQKSTKVDQVIDLKVVQSQMKFDKELLQVKAGTTVQIVFQNPDFMQHNFVLIKPNTTEKVGAAADKLAQDPNGAKVNYVPKMPEVLQSTPLLNPEGKFTLTFKVPALAGDYPYICTFPGHWRIMKGVMKVTK